MSIVRIKRSNYTAISRSLLQGKNLSFETRGMLGYLLSHADNWECRVSDIEQNGGIGKFVRRRMMKEAELAGYLTFTKSRGKDGRYVSAYTVFECPVDIQDRTRSWEVGGDEPDSDEPDMDEPDVDSPQPDNPPPVLSPPVNRGLYIESDLRISDLKKREREEKLSPPSAIEDFDGHNEEMDAVVSFLKESYHLTGYIPPYQERNLVQASFQILQNKIPLADLKLFFTTARKIPPMNFLVSDYFLAQENASRSAKASPATQNTNIVARLKEQMPDEIRQSSEATQAKWMANHYSDVKQQMATATN